MAKKTVSKKKSTTKKNLVIVESPAKAKTIEKYLGKNYRVVASVGHIRDLKKSSMSIDFDNNYEPEYINIRGKGPLINSLKMMKNSGFLTFGIELVEENIGKIQYLIVASDCNKKNSDKILKLCKDKKIKYIITASKRELGEVFLKEEINVIGVMDKKSTRGLLS